MNVSGFHISFFFFFRGEGGGIGFGTKNNQPYNLDCLKKLQGETWCGLQFLNNLKSCSIHVLKISVVFNVSPVFLTKEICTQSGPLGDKRLLVERC